MIQSIILLCTRGGEVVGKSIHSIILCNIKNVQVEANLTHITQNSPTRFWKNIYKLGKV